METYITHKDYQKQIELALKNTEHKQLSEFTAKLFQIQNDSREMKEKAQKDIYDQKRNEDIAESQKDIERLREESSKTEATIRSTSKLNRNSAFTG